MPLIKLEDIAQLNKDLENNKPVAILFYTEWSNPSKQAIEEFGELSKSMSDVAFYVVDGEDNLKAALTCQVIAFPTLVTIKGLEVAKHVSWPKNKKAFELIRAMLN